MKKFVAIVVVLVIILTMTISASAEELKKLTFFEQVYMDVQRSLRESMEDDESISIDYTSEVSEFKGHKKMDIVIEVTTTTEDFYAIVYMTVYEDGSYVGWCYDSSDDSTCIQSGDDYTEVI